MDFLGMGGTSREFGHHLFIVLWIIVFRTMYCDGTGVGVSRSTRLAATLVHQGLLAPWKERLPLLLPVLKDRQG